MDNTEVVEKALKRAYALGQKYWSEADSEYASDWKRADVTQQQFKELLAETLASIDRQSNV